jgi:hypothetical protein
MDVIIGELTDKFKGQALAAAQGYSGQMDRLTVASQNAKEIIGKDLLDAMQMIAGRDGIGGATTAIESFATQIGNAIYGVGVLITKLKSIPGAGLISDIFSAGTKFSGFGLLSKLGASSKATPAQSPGERKAIDKINADAIKIQKQQNALKTLDNKIIKEKIEMTAGEKALAELKKIFDIEGIQLQAALNGVLTKEEEARVKGLIAINNSDGALAIQALSALNAADATNSFADAARQAALKLQTSYSAGLQSFKQSEINSLTQTPLPPSITQGVPVVPQSPLQSFRQNEAQYASTGGVSIQINPAVAGLIDVIQNQSASGISPTVNRISSSYLA